MKNKLIISCLLTLSFLSAPVYALKPYEIDSINVYKKLSPSVVTINTTSYEEDDFMDPVPRQGSGSGVVIDKSGYILTNFHVIENASKIDVVFDKISYPAVVIGTAPNNDLAILQVKAPANILKPAKLGDSSKLQIGQTAIAVGNPFGVLGRTMTSGIISSVNRDVKIQNMVFRGMIQTDAAINGGNSGGPLVNTDGEVIGINTLIFSQTGGSVGIGFAIPINTAKRFIPSLITKGTVTYPALGVSVMPITSEVSQLLGLPVKEGLLVLNTMPNGSAQKAGIKGGNKFIQVGNGKLPIGGDIIVALDEEKVKTVEDLSSYLQTNKEVGSQVTVTIIRGRKIGKVNVKLQARPNSRT